MYHSVDSLHFDGEPCLAHIATALLKGKPSRALYQLPNGSIEAVVDSDVATISRIRGVHSKTNRLAFTATDLEVVHRALTNWAELRRDFAMFDETSAGHPPGFGCSTIAYWPPGKDSKRVKIGGRAMGRPTGETLCGKTVRCKLATPATSLEVFRLWPRTSGSARSMGQPKEV